ncbi:unnamed protein product, partial [Symbiodinium sp. CCMP2592]
SRAQLAPEPPSFCRIWEQSAAQRWGFELVKLLTPLWPRRLLQHPMPIMESYIVEWLLCEISRTDEEFWRV